MTTSNKNDIIVDRYPDHIFVVKTLGRKGKMTQPYDVKVTVISQKGECSAGHKVGDSWVVGLTCPEGICFSAVAALNPVVRALRFGGVFPWREDKDTGAIACPDPENMVVFELRRLR